LERDFDRSGIAPSTWLWCVGALPAPSPLCYAGPIEFESGSFEPATSLRGDVSAQPPAGIRELGPVLTAAAMFTVSDVFGKLALEGGADVLSLLTFRSILGIGLVFVWLRLGKPPVTLSRSATLISLALGVLLTANLFSLFKAIELVAVSIAILTYFIYPLLTGILGAMTGADRLTVRGAAIAVVAFIGLALIIGASPSGLAALGILAAVAAALCRTAMLLVTRATLKGADTRLVTWYTLWSSTLVFAALSMLTRNWHWPHSAPGWIAFVGIGFTTTAAISALYVSTQRIGPFRTALFMNLEPLMTAALSAVVLGDRMTPPQVFGGAIMIAALCFFQAPR
jgi:probable blue pigment (indigoidine) exporter